MQFIAGVVDIPVAIETGKHPAFMAAMKVFFRGFRCFFALLRVVPEYRRACWLSPLLKLDQRCSTTLNNNNITIWGGSVLTGEEPAPHSGELKHALPQAGGPTQSQLSRPMSSGHPHLHGVPTTEETVKL